MSKKTAVITGASSGIGMELARLFAADGYDLIVTARRVERLQQLSEELGNAHGTEVRIIRQDIAQPMRVRHYGKRSVHSPRTSKCWSTTRVSVIPATLPKKRRKSSSA